MENLEKGFYYRVDQHPAWYSGSVKVFEDPVVLVLATRVHIASLRLHCYNI